MSHMGDHRAPTLSYAEEESTLGRRSFSTLDDFASDKHYLGMQSDLGIDLYNPDATHFKLCRPYFTVLGVFGLWPHQQAWYTYIWNCIIFILAAACFALDIASMFTDIGVLRILLGTTAPPSDYFFAIHATVIVLNSIPIMAFIVTRNIFKQPVFFRLCHYIVKTHPDELVQLSRLYAVVVFFGGMFLGIVIICFEEFWKLAKIVNSPVAGWSMSVFLVFVNWVWCSVTLSGFCALAFSCTLLELLIRDFRVNLARMGSSGQMPLDELSKEWMALLDRVDETSRAMRWVWLLLSGLATPAWGLQFFTYSQGQTVVKWPILISFANVCAALYGIWRATKVTTQLEEVLSTFANWGQVGFDAINTPGRMQAFYVYASKSRSVGFYFWAHRGLKATRAVALTFAHAGMYLAAAFFILAREPLK